MRVIPQALWTDAPQHATLRGEDVVPPLSGQVLVETHFSGISRGTERLVWSGQVPDSEHQRMRCPHMAGSFRYPVKYGYALVGHVIDGDAAPIGQRVFVLHPHQSHCVVDAADLRPIPDDVPDRRAILAANLETAVNALWDAEIGIGDRVTIVGGGVLGLLVARLARGVPGAQVTVVDPLPDRRAMAQQAGAAAVMPDGAPEDQDIVLHCSATEAGLLTALQAAGNQAKVVEVSWFGSRAVTLPLGQAFHSRRLQLISSQVGQIPPVRAPRWTYARRMQTALALLADPWFDRMITAEVAFEDAPDALPAIFSPDAPGLMTAIRYPAAGDDER